MHSSSLGKQGEDLVAGYLQRRGWQIVAQNWQTIEGELDIIAYKNHQWKFVEVKTRTRSISTVGHAAEALHTQKHQRLERAMYAYIEKYSISEDYSLDAALVYIGKHKARIIYYPNAFEAYHDI